MGQIIFKQKGNLLRDAEKILGIVAPVETQLEVIKHLLEASYFFGIMEVKDSLEIDLIEENEALKKRLHELKNINNNNYYKIRKLQGQIKQYLLA